MKEYIKPEVEIISLMANEAVTVNEIDEVIDGELTLSEFSFI